VGIIGQRAECAAPVSERLNGHHHQQLSTIISSLIEFTGGCSYSRKTDYPIKGSLGPWQTPCDKFRPSNLFPATAPCWIIIGHELQDCFLILSDSVSDLVMCIVDSWSTSYIVIRVLMNGCCDCKLMYFCWKSVPTNRWISVPSIGENQCLHWWKSVPYCYYISVPKVNRNQCPSTLKRRADGTDH